MAPSMLSLLFETLCPRESTGQGWESFKLGYIGGLWKNSQELAVPVCVIDTHPDPTLEPAVVGFMAIVYTATGLTTRLELLDF